MVSSPPLGLQVSPGVAGGDDTIQRFSTGQGDRRRDVEALGDDILPAPGGVSVADRTFAGAVPVMASLLLLSILGALGLLVRSVVARRRVDPWAALAMQQIPSELAARVATLSGLFREAAALRLGCAPSEIDRNRLQALGEAVVGLYADLEAARYGGGDAAGLEARVRAFIAKRGAL